MPPSPSRPHLLSLLDVAAGSSSRPWRLAPHALLLVLADLAILVALETALTSFGGEGSGAREVLLMGLGMVVAGLEFRYLLRRSGQQFRETVSATWRRLSDKVGRLELMAFERLGADRLHRQLTLETSMVAEVGVHLVSALRYALRTATCLLYVLWLAPQMAAVLGVGLGLVGLIRVVGSGFAMERLAAIFATRAALLDAKRAIVRGFTQVRLHRPRRAALLAQVSELASALADLQDRLHREFIKIEGLAEVTLYGLVTAVAVGVGSVAPELGARLMVALFFALRSLGEVTVAIPRLMEATSALHRLSALEQELDDALRVAPEEEALAPIQGIEGFGLREVVFRYDDGAFLFGPTSLEVHPEEVLFITGHNGSGKTTCLKLMLGLYPPVEGHLELNGAPLPPRPAQAWRDQFSVVLSEFVLFERLLGVEGEDAEDRARALLRDVGLAHVVRIEDGRLSTVDLSTGQRKRLALVLALLRDRPVFVFDEWAADQDPEFRDAFYNQVLPELKRRGKTVICVTHDDGFFHLADREVVFADGRVRA